MTSGDILLAGLDPTVGREQGGRRPVVVVSAPRYSEIPDRFLAVPLTSTQRGLVHHVTVPADRTTGLDRVSYAMTEQVRVLSRQRIVRKLGSIGPQRLAEISHYLHLFIA